MHKIDVPEAMAAVDELIVPTSYPAKGADDPAFALFVLHLQAGTGRSFAAEVVHLCAVSGGATMDLRAARDKESHRIFGECFGVGTFLLEEDGCRLAEWLEKDP